MGRTHGCASPLNAWQCAASAVVIAMVANFHAAYAPLLAPGGGPDVRVALETAFALLAVATVWLGARVMLCDPSEPNVRLLAQGHAAASLQGDCYCALCEVRVSRKAKHCRACNRCVDGFDHHCKWLNNCVGAANYRNFVWLLAAASMLSVAHGAASAVAIWRATTDGERLRERSYGSSLTPEGAMGLAVTMVLLSAASLYAVADLLSFHMVLMREGLTTYEYIMQRRSTDAGAPSKRTKSEGGRAVVCLPRCGNGGGGGKVAPAGSGDGGSAKRPARRVKLNACGVWRFQRAEDDKGGPGDDGAKLEAAERGAADDTKPEVTAKPALAPLRPPLTLSPNGTLLAPSTPTAATPSALAIGGFGNTPSTAGPTPANGAALLPPLPLPGVPRAVDVDALSTGGPTPPPPIASLASPLPELQLHSLDTPSPSMARN
jgi:hypothetical protein